LIAISILIVPLQPMKRPAHPYFKITIHQSTNFIRSLHRAIVLTLSIYGCI